MFPELGGPGSQHVVDIVFVQADDLAIVDLKIKSRVRLHGHHGQVFSQMFVERFEPQIAKLAKTVVWADEFEALALVKFEILRGVPNEDVSLKRLSCL